jgi:aminoglycoside phosphotransferase (APT) family kinase protein
MGNAWPSDPAGITPAWLNGVLGGPVRAVQARALAAEEGLTGRVLRLRLKYASRQPGVPASLVAKFSTSNAALRLLLHRFRLYEREQRFYQEVAARVPVPTPRCYFAGLDAATGNSLLLLEDLDGHRCGDNVAGCTRDEAARVLRLLARVHARFWQHPDLDRMPWVPGVDEHAGEAQELYAQAWLLFAAKFQDLLPGAFVDVARRFGPYVAAQSRRLGRPPQTLVHGDLRLSHVLFPPSAGSAAPAVIDWQMLLRGAGTLDVAYLTVSCLPTEQRRAWEDRLLEEYHAALLDHGVRGYSRDQLREAYRHSVLHVAFRVVTAGALLDLSSEPQRDLTAIVTRRCAAAWEDHQAGGILSA